MSYTKEFITKCNFTSFIILLLIFSISIFHFYLSIHNEIVGLIADDAMYLLMTDYFSPYYKPLSSSASFVMNTSQFPPLYPVLLAILGASSEKLQVAHFITTSCLIGVTFVYVLWTFEESKKINASLSLALIFLCSPATLLMNIDLWSEHLYMLTSILALFSVSKAEKNEKYWIIAVLFVGLLPLIRSVGIVLVFALSIYLYVHKVNRRYKLIVAALVPFFLWQVISVTFFSSDVYEDVLSNFYKYGILAHIKYLFSDQLPNLWAGWHECFDIHKSIVSGVVASIILLMLSGAWFFRLSRLRIDSIYLLLYFIVIWLWPDPNHSMRFMYAVLPILIYYSYLSLSLLIKKITSNKIKAILNYGVICIVLVTFSPTNLYAVNKLFIDAPVGYEQYKYTKYWITAKNNFMTEQTIKIMDRMNISYAEASQFIPEDSCVHTPHQEGFMYYARRLAFPFPLPKEVEENNINPLLQCNYIHVLHTTSHPEYPGGYPINVLNDFNNLMSTRINGNINSDVIAELLKLN